MAVAWTKDRVGSASADVIVRDPVVLAGTLPRFLSVGDRSRFFMQLDNVEGPAGDYTVDLDLRGPIVVAADALRSHHAARRRRPKGGVTIPVTAAGRASPTIDVTLTGPRRRAGDAELHGRASSPAPARWCAAPCGRSQPGASLTVSSDLVADILAGTGAVSVSVSPLAASTCRACCRPSTAIPTAARSRPSAARCRCSTSTSSPQEENLALDDKADERVRGAIERVLARQDSNGSFGLWSVGRRRPLARCLRRPTS